MTYAYARVSATDQNLARQLDEFRKLDILDKNIYSDKKSGKDFNRAAYKLLIKKLKKDDLLVIKSIDRLGRNYQSIIQEWNKIVRIICADILVIDMPLLDTRDKTGTLIGKFTSDIVLQVLSFVAENERDNIHTRQLEGIALAKASGVRFGRPQRTHSEAVLDAMKKYSEKKLSLHEILLLTEMKQPNFFYHYRRFKKGLMSSEALK